METYKQIKKHKRTHKIQTGPGPGPELVLVAVHVENFQCTN